MDERLRHRLSGEACRFCKLRDPPYGECHVLRDTAEVLTSDGTDLAELFDGGGEPHGALRTLAEFAPRNTLQVAVEHVREEKKTRECK